jgi:hypothetical protein
MFLLLCHLLWGLTLGLLHSLTLLLPWLLCRALVCLLLVLVALRL